MYIIQPLIVFVSFTYLIVFVFDLCQVAVTLYFPFGINKVLYPSTSISYNWQFQTWYFFIKYTLY